MHKSIVPLGTAQASRPAQYRPDIRVDAAAGVEWAVKSIGPTTVVSIRPDTSQIQARPLDLESLAAIQTWAAKQNKAGSNLYFHINQPSAGLARKAARTDIVCIRGLYLDVDAKDGRTLEEARDAALAVAMPPTFVIATGGGYQPVWLLDPPLRATPDIIARVEALGRQLEAATGSDPVSNVDRILRLPFTLNYPNKKKRAAHRGVSISGLLLELAE